MKELATATVVAAAVVTTGVAVNATTAHADDDDATTGAPVSTASATVQTPTGKAENTANAAITSLADATQQANNTK